jgi:hypothetical protein
MASCDSWTAAKLYIAVRWQKCPIILAFSGHFRLSQHGKDFFIWLLTPGRRCCLNGSRWRGTRCFAALAGHSTLETLGFQTGPSGRKPVVSKKPAVRCRAGCCSRFCSLTIEFEGRETQTAGSWRICGRKTASQTDSGYSVFLNTIHRDVLGSSNRACAS